MIDPESLIERGIIKRQGDAVKLLAKGDIGYPLSVKIHMVSDAAREKLEAAGGSIEVI